MSLYFTNLGGRASLTAFTAAVAVHAICSGPKRPSSTGTLCEFRLRRGTVLCDCRRPSFTSKPCDCCDVGIGRVLLSGPRGPGFTRRHCDFGFCRGAVLCDPKRPSCLSPELRQVPDVLLALSGLVVCRRTTWSPTVPPMSTRWDKSPWEPLFSILHTNHTTCSVGSPSLSTPTPLTYPVCQSGPWVIDQRVARSVQK